MEYFGDHLHPGIKESSISWIPRATMSLEKSSSAFEQVADLFMPWVGCPGSDGSLGAIELRLRRIVESSRPGYGRVGVFTQSQ